MFSQNGNELLLSHYSLEELIEKAKEQEQPYKILVLNGKPIYENKDASLLEGEEFKKHPEENVYVSNMGRVKSPDTLEILDQFPDADEKKYDYLYVRITSRRIYKRLVYQLVAETWLENPDREQYSIVHHLTNNGYDNRVTNLMWVSKKQHYDIHEWGKSKI